MTTLRGQRHEHYRKLIAPPLKRPAVLAMSPQMARIAASRSPPGRSAAPFQLTDAARTMAKHLAIGLLFGDDRERAMPIADMIARAMQASWILPTPALYRWLKEAEAQERAILDWAEEKRGNPDSQDILSILINNTDEAGNPAPLDLIGGLTSFIFGAAYDTCQNALAWTLILLTQHPEAMAALVAEIDGAVGGELATMDRIGALPRLDWTIKEAMRLFPPVPVQMRKATRPTTLGGEAAVKGDRVVISALQINRDPTIYAEPDSFRPERWAEIKPSPFQYTTFGAGGHMCPGVTFGMQMMKIALATILSKRTVELSRHLAHRLPNPCDAGSGRQGRGHPARARHARAFDAGQGRFPQPVRGFGAGMSAQQKMVRTLRSADAQQPPAPLLRQQRFLQFRLLGRGRENAARGERGAGRHPSRPPAPQERQHPRRRLRPRRLDPAAAGQLSAGKHHRHQHLGRAGRSCP